MKLREHPSIMGRWPPYLCEARAKSPAGPSDCLEGLRTAHHLEPSETGLPGNRLQAVFNGQIHIRELFIYNQALARTLSKFLRDRQGKTIRALGELDVTFEFVPSLVQVARR